MKNAETLKKGRSTWQPANVLDVFDKEPGYRYRIVEKSPKNVAKKEREGWEIVSAINGAQTSLDQGNYLDKPKQQTSVLEGYDYVVMRIPEEMAKERDTYFNSESARRMSALRKEAKAEMSKSGGAVHGEITFEKKGIRNVIKD